MKPWRSSAAGLAERPFRYSFYLEGKIKKRLAEARPEQREDFYRVLEQICLNPKGWGLPLKDNVPPSAFTASFDQAVMLYQVLADHPVVWVLQITWLEDFAS